MTSSVSALDNLLPITLRRLGRRTVAAEEEPGDPLWGALASADDPASLLPLILETAVEVTGAVGGMLHERCVVTARTGDVPPLAEPLRLKLAGRKVPTVEALLYPPFGGFSAAERRRAERFGARAAVALESACRRAIERRRAGTDLLTGLVGRTQFLEQLAGEAWRQPGFGRPVALIVAELDELGLVNDRYGHDTGDAVLRAFAELLTSAVRELDVAARLGGGEFAVLLPETDAAGAAVLATRLRERLERLEVPAPAGGQLTVTASFGFAVSPPVESVDELPEAAGAALQRAKHAGTNRVVEAVLR